MLNMNMSVVHLTFDIKLLPTYFFSKAIVEIKPDIETVHLNLRLTNGQFQGTSGHFTGKSIIDIKLIRLMRLFCRIVRFCNPIGL